MATSPPEQALPGFWQFFSRILNSIARSFRRIAVPFWTTSHARSTLATPLFGNIGFGTAPEEVIEKRYVDRTSDRRFLSISDGCWPLHSRRRRARSAISAHFR